MSSATLNPPPQPQASAARRSIRELGDLTGRTALVTGGAGHIGSAIAEALAEAGARVAIVDLDPARCGETVARLMSQPEAIASAHPCDLSEPDQLVHLCQSVVQLHGSLDIVVHAAAWTGATNVEGWNASFDRQTIAAWERSMTVNLTSAFALSKAAAPMLAACGKGSLVFIGSIYGSAGPDWRLYEGTNMTCPAAYAAAKGGVLQLTRYLATTLAPSVRVNLISPGGILRGQPAIFVDRYSARTPLGRLGREEDIKGAAVFLASDLSLYVTGINLPVDGGWTTW